MRTPEGWHKAWRGIRYCFKMPQTPKTRAHPGSELRFATVLAIICHHRFPGFHFLFVDIQGFGASSLRFLRPRRPFAGAHSTTCLTSVAPAGLQVRRACARGNTHFSSHTAHANVRYHSRERLGLTPLHANARPNGLTRGAPNGAPTSDLSFFFAPAINKKLAMGRRLR